MENIINFFRYIFQNPFPLAIDKNGHGHCLLSEGYPQTIIAKGCNYEKIVEKYGPPKRLN